MLDLYEEYEYNKGYITAKTLNRIAKDRLYSLKSDLRKSSITFAEKILLPYLKQLAEKGYFYTSFSVKVIHYFPDECTFSFSDFESSEEGYSLNIIGDYLKQLGFKAEYSSLFQAYYISWEDKNVN